MNTSATEIELKEIKQELKILNQNLATMTKMMQNYMIHKGVYFDPRNPDLTRFKK